MMEQDPSEFVYAADGQVKTVLTAPDDTTYYEVQTVAICCELVGRTLTINRIAK